MRLRHLHMGNPVVCNTSYVFEQTYNRRAASDPHRGEGVLPLGVWRGRIERVAPLRLRQTTALHLLGARLVVPLKVANAKAAELFVGDSLAPALDRCLHTTGTAETIHGSLCEVCVRR